MSFYNKAILSEWEKTEFLVKTTCYNPKIDVMQNAKLRNNIHAGFTLIELLVVIAIIGILASVVLASLDTARSKARDARRLSDLQQLRTALEIYYSSNNRYPPATNSVVSAITGLAPTYIASLPEDPTRVGTAGYRYWSSNYSQGYTLLVNLETDAVGWCRPPGGEPGYSPWVTAYAHC